MESVKRHSQYSQFHLLKIESGRIYPDKLNPIYIHSIYQDWILVECISDDDWHKYLLESVPQKIEETRIKPEVKIDKQVIQALSTVLNYDPFNMGADNKTLREIYRDLPKWVEIARLELKNKYILEKIKTIDEFIKNGGNINE